MFGGKRYGESRVAACPFCGAHAYAKNEQGIPVCADHKDSSLADMKCSCGSWLDLREGKWGPFFLCEKCGPVNLNKALEMNADRPRELQERSTVGNATMGTAQRKNPYVDENGRDIFVRSDDPRYDFR